MLTLRAVHKLLAPVRRRISLLVTRAVVSLVDSEQAMQMLQIKGLADELLDDAEHFEAYGYTSRPHAGAEGVALSAGGQRSHCIVVCVGDRRYRLKGLKGGEVAMYSDEGDSVHFKRGRKIAVTGGEEVSVATKMLKAEASASADIVSPEIVATCDTFDVTASTAASVDTPRLTVTGDLAVGGNVTADGMVEDAAGSMDEMRQVYNGHIHTAPSGGGPTTPPAQGMS